MPHTDNGRNRKRPDARRRPNARRTLRSETPSTVAVLADEKDFAAMRRYASFLFDDHATYLRHVEGLLRSLAAQGTYTSVALFDPDDYERYCTGRHLNPDTALSRTRYTADVAAAGTRLPYEGQPLARLLPRLVDEAEQQATWEYASALLSAGGDCVTCGEDIGRAAFARASRALRLILEAVGEGAHHLVCSVPADEETPLIAVLHTECRDGALHLGEAAALVFCTVLAAGLATDRPGGIVLRSSLPDRPDTVRGWGLRGGGLRPLTEAEVFAAYCTDAETGEPVPPEHGVEYRAGIPLDLDGDV
ncbi:hypothetical protein [Streptomyces sp. C36]|uniref:hypothetical protein n=1 Tax=Streptomyces sp. C36 TaxID=3237122 RepID=UPI0034C60A74